MFPKDFHFYESNQLRTREFYEMILVDSESVEIEHTLDSKSERVQYSKVKILKVMTLSHWKLKPHSQKTLNGYPGISTYDYNDYKDIWYKAFLLRNYNHSWFFYFDQRFTNSYHNWFLTWFKFYGNILDNFPEPVKEGFITFKDDYFDKSPNVQENIILQFTVNFHIPWILTWTYSFSQPTETNPSYMLFREFRTKFWEKFSQDKANSNSVRLHFKLRCTPCTPTKDDVRLFHV